MGEISRTDLRRVRRMSPRRAGALLISLLAATGFLALIFASTASAYTDPPVKLALEPGNVELAESLLLEDSPRKITGIESTASSGRAYEDFLSPPAEASTAAETELESAEVPELLAESSAWTWAAVPPLAVAVGGFWAGWEIGSTVWGIFFEESEPKVEKVSYEANEWDSYPPGEVLLSDRSGTIYAPGFGLRGQGGGATYGNVTDTGYCESELFGDGERLYSPGWLPSYGCGAEHQRNYVLWKPLGVINCGKEAALCPGIEPIPYGEPYESQQPPAPSSAEVQEDLEKALATSEYSEFNRFFNYFVQPENYPDPRVVKKEVDDEKRRCDRGVPEFENPGGNGSPPEFTKREETGFPITNLPSGFREAGPAYLLWGTTYWAPGRAGFKGTPFLDAWRGWGYRHIAAKHGWDATDRTETALALANAVPIPGNEPGKYSYEYPDAEGGLEGAECIRKVVVDFETGEGDPAPREIVTSYNISK